MVSPTALIIVGSYARASHHELRPLDSQFKWASAMIQIMENYYTKAIPNYNNSTLYFGTLPPQFEASPTDSVNFGGNCRLQSNQTSKDLR